MISPAERSPIELLAIMIALSVSGSGERVRPENPRPRQQQWRRRDGVASLFRSR
jgi:hypothetical protein